jgi:3-dehydroquinate dehydratase-2
MRIVIVNGPNLNWLGRRQRELYGKLGLATINDRIREYAKSRGIQVDFFQANGEGEIIDILQAQADSCQGMVLNPGAYGHYSLAVADALAALSVPVIEVHLTNVFAREEIRHRHVTAGACTGYICGLGWQGYILAVQAILNQVEGEECKGE